MNYGGGSPEFGEGSVSILLPAKREPVGRNLFNVRGGHFPRSVSIAAACLVVSLLLTGCASPAARTAIATTPEVLQTPTTAAAKAAESTAIPTATKEPTKPAPTPTEAATATPPESTATPESFYQKGIVYAGSLTPEGSDKPTGAFILYSAPLSEQQIIYFTVKRQCAGSQIPETKAFSAGKQVIQGNTLKQKIEGIGNLSLQESVEEKRLTGTLRLDANPNIGPGCPLEDLNISAQQKGDGPKPLAQSLIEAYNTYQGAGLRPDIPLQKILDGFAKNYPDSNLAKDLQIDKK